MRCGGFLMLEYQQSSAATPHARNALGGRYSISARAGIMPNAIKKLPKAFERKKTSEATSSADFGEGLWAGDDFWYPSMRNLPSASPRSELRKTELKAKA